MFQSLRDPDGDFDLVLVMYVLGFLVACFKLVVSGNTILGVQMSSFTGSDFGMVIAALGGVYSLRKHSDGVIAKNSKDGS